jgi:hypothetical protein
MEILAKMCSGITCNGARAPWNPGISGKPRFSDAERLPRGAGPIASAVLAHFRVVLKRPTQIDGEPGNIKDSELKTSKAWFIKESFRFFGEQPGHRDAAKEYFEEWYRHAIYSKLAPMK